jgi:hypothetical protein
MGLEIEVGVNGAIYTYDGDKSLFEETGLQDLVLAEAKTFDNFNEEEGAVKIDLVKGLTWKCFHPPLGADAVSTCFFSLN